ncbi:hypothetical protein QGM71_18485 [Virgibacillus sp. C22-A2]|uniref:Uncharacterized protein n=1 Tax=Virgibacillus tibetensis TaxID=3042313 RepID=A0ABU6KJH9_9BACI|nr:hypothetical protein [Virgibacillus sp. C22-A2]
MGIVLIYLPIILIFVVIYLISNLLKRQINNYGKSIKWMLFVYIGILLISMVTYYLLPIDSKLVKEESGDSEVVPDLYNYRDKIEEIDKSYIKKKWKMEYQNDEIDIKAPENDVNGTSIRVHSTSELESEIEVIYYQTPTNIKGVDVTKHAPVPNVVISSDALTIYNSEQVDLEFTMLSLELPFSQFTREAGDSSWMSGSGVEHGAELIYIRVPETVELNIEPGYGIY